MSKYEVQCLWDLGAQLGEGPLWVAEQQRLYFVDLKSKTLHAFDTETGQRHAWEMPDYVCWLIARADGDGFMAGLRHGIARVWLEPELRIDYIAHPFAPGSDLRLNDAKVDSAGRIWAGSMHNETPDQPHGQLACLHPDGRIEVVERGIHIANGPAISADGTVLLHTDTWLNTIYRYQLGADGQLRDKTVWKTFAEGEGSPDGMTFDAEGYVWIAFWGGACIRRFSLDGSLLQQVDMPASQITNVAFGGADLDLMLVTSARVDLTAEQLAQQPLAGSAFVLRTGVRGVLPGVWGPGV